MKKRLIFMFLIACTIGMQAQTLDECQKAAERNYPLIKQYDLIAKTTELTVQNIQKGWLPQIRIYGEATYQSDVTAWPGSMTSMFNQLGINMKGIQKDHYKVGFDLQQTLYDGEAINHQRAVAQQQGKVQEAQNEVNLYNLRKRVNELYFALLLLDEQIKLNDDVQTLLKTSEAQLFNMVKGGTAANSDLENVKAERLSAEQQQANLKAQRTMLATLLSTFCGIAVNHPQKPVVVSGVTNGNQRPEMKLFDAQLRLAETEEKALDAALMPKVGVFVQGYYGYPGLNMFEDMMRHRWSLNGVVGLSVSWNVGALYTRKNDKAKLQLQRASTENQRKVFLFNNKLDAIQQQANIERYKKMMQSDDEIIQLRRNVRKAAESKLSHGIIDVTSLLREINSENAAKIQQSIHEIDLLKEIYNLKYTNNE